MISLSKKRFAIVLVALFSFFFGISKFPYILHAEDCNTQCQIDKINDQIKQYQAKLTELKNQSNTLANQVAQFDTQITLAELKIEEAENQIDLFSNRIDQLQGSLDSLSSAYQDRVKETYKMQRTGEPILILVTALNANEAVSRFHYLEKIQEADHDLLLKLQSTQNNYKENKNDLESLRVDLLTQKANLDSQRQAKANLLTATKSDEKKYQQLLSQAQAQLNAFRNFVSNQGGATILQNQTVCNDWGCYYNQRDSQWGTRGLGTSNLSVAAYGCLVSSSAMIATHYRKNLNPGDIASTAAAFFSPNSDTALLWIDITVNGIRISRTSIGVSTANIDAELAAGRPVIVGLYSGPAHFIVLKSGSNGNYIMNDPFMENGHDVSFTSKYSLSNITDVERVSVQ